MTDPIRLDWGAATAEFYDSEKNAAVHIFNHALGTPEGAERAIRFALARLRYFSTRVPQGGTQEIWFDDREQTIPDDLRKKVRDALTPHVAGLLFMSEGAA